MTDATIIIAAWNAAETIERSLQSALNQKGLSKQVVIVDDASEQDFREFIPVRGDVVFDRLNQNGGPAAARNRAITHATGEWICVLDSDDEMLPNRVSKMIEMAERVQADILLGNFQKVGEGGRILPEGVFLNPNHVDQEAKVTLETYVLDNIINKKSKGTGYLKPIIRRSFLERTNLRYNKDLRNGEDCHLIFDALIRGAKVHIWGQPDYLYSVREGSISYRINPEHFEALVKADQKFVEKNRDRMSSQVAKLFFQREIGLRKMMETERILQDLKSHNFLKAVRHLIQHPYALNMVGRQLKEALSKRLAKS